MKHLVRTEFLDEEWDSVLFDVVTELWVDLYERADELLQFRVKDFYSHEIRLRGFPRQEAERIEEAVPDNLFGPHFPRPYISRPDPDQIVIWSGYTEFDEGPMRGFHPERLREKVFDGLMVEVRFSILGVKDSDSFDEPKLQSTLVIIGELRDGIVLVKALWRVGASGWEERVLWTTPWPAQERVLLSLDEVRYNEVDTDALARELFVPRRTDAFTGLLVALLSAPKEPDNRVPELLKRWGWYSFALVVATVLIVVSILSEKWLAPWIALVAILLGAGLGLIFSWLFFRFSRNELGYFFNGYSEYRKSYKRTFSQSTQTLPVSADVLRSERTNPWAHKYLTEVAALGCTHIGDYTIMPEIGGRGLISMFYHPDGLTYLVVTIMTEIIDENGEVTLKVWPGIVALSASTHFTDGTRFLCTNAIDLGYRRNRSGDDLKICVIKDVSDPGEFVARHIDSARRFADETGRTPAPHRSTAEYIRFHEEVNERERELYHDRPYTWADHLHWYLGRIRSEYRDDSGTDPRDDSSF